MLCTLNCTQLFSSNYFRTTKDVNKVFNTSMILKLEPDSSWCWKSFFSVWWKLKMNLSDCEVSVSMTVKEIDGIRFAFSCSPSWKIKILSFWNKKLVFLYPLLKSFFDHNFHVQSYTTFYTNFFVFFWFFFLVFNMKMRE